MHPVLRKGRWAFLLAAFFLSLCFGQERIRQCAKCHGDDGNSAEPGVPSIAGQPKVFLETQLVLAREGLRGGDEMQQVLKGISDREVVSLAEHFSRQALRPADAAVNRPLFDHGAVLAKRLGCGTCHLSDFRGQQQVPRLAGQREEYLEEAMRTFRDNPRRGGDTIMTAALYGVSNADIKALAHFLSRSRPRP